MSALVQTHLQCHVAMPSGLAEHQDLKDISGASCNGIVNSGAHHPQVPLGVIIFQETSNVCRVGAEEAPPRVLARVVEAQRFDN